MAVAGDERSDSYLADASKVGTGWKFFTDILTRVLTAMVWLKGTNERTNRAHSFIHFIYGQWTYD